MVPSVTLDGWFTVKRSLDRQIRNLLNHPLEINRAHRPPVGVRRGIHIIDGVRSVADDRKLDGVDVITQRLVDLNRLSSDASLHFGIEIIVDDKIALEYWVVRHRAYILLPNAIRTYVVSKRNVLLQNHTICSAGII